MYWVQLWLWLKNTSSPGSEIMQMQERSPGVGWGNWVGGTAFREDFLYSIWKPGEKSEVSNCITRGNFRCRILRIRGWHSTQEKPKLTPEESIRWGSGHCFAHGRSWDGPVWRFMNLKYRWDLVINVIYLCITGVSDIGHGGVHRSYQILFDITQVVGEDWGTTFSVPGWMRVQGRSRLSLFWQNQSSKLNYIKKGLLLENSFNLTAHTPFTIRYFVPKKFWHDYKKTLCLSTGQSLGLRKVIARRNILCFWEPIVDLASVGSNWISRPIL